ncbi:hypothetical protein SAMN05443575_1614 [Jatrophihabitans endophyticus]|uniref:Peptidase M10 metallopeptidase domain-containing protein n=1 Tax=Jatrophihabitans endophyticus TaxID=1206085 RepID=A0A1M5HS12_9ACTN|nr:matrixin family metalloprotease [Jatrophihabitans endophyticus]SHG18648.1 hypothetical protein SAMN05443575_1614 [Jatrophihabitans endophyticus]
MADNGVNTWFGYYLDNQTKSALAWTVKYIENETVIDEKGTDTHDGNTDVIYNDGHYATQDGPPCVGNNKWYPNGGVIGYTVCWSLSGQACQQHRIYIDLEWEYDSAQTAGWDQALMLHESGHGLGLTHSSQISNEVMSPQIVKIDYYSQHDKDLINGNY